MNIPLTVALAASFALQEKKDVDLSRSVEFLLGEQRKDGSWSGRSGAEDPEASCTAIAVSALVCIALLDHSDTNPDKIKAAVDKGVKICFADPDPKDFLSQVTFTWSQAYALHLAGRLLKHKAFKDREKEWRVAAGKALERLYAAQRKSGAWGYGTFGTSFQTADVLVALAEARDAGIEVDQGKVDRAVAFLKQLRTDKGMLYAPGKELRKNWDALAEKEALDRTAGRIVLCDHALLRWKALKKEELEASMQKFFDHKSYLWDTRAYRGEEARPKSWIVTEYETPYGNFAYYACFNTAQALASVGADKRRAWAAELKKDLLKTRLANETWEHLSKESAKVSDVGVGNGAYATAMAALALKGIEPAEKK